MTRLSDPDLRDLEKAHRLLESPGLAVQLASGLGKPIEAGLKKLPGGAAGMVQQAAQSAIDKALNAAVTTLDLSAGTPASADTLHKAMAGVTGAVGGYFGAGGLLVELPISTTIMLRSIADIARSEGEDFSHVEAKLACVEVFALGGRSAADDAAETAYFAVRAGMAKALTEAAAVIARRGVVQGSSSAIVDFVAKVAARFGVSVSQKFAAQMVPVIGAATGATINLIFTDHFQDMARGHFTVRRLERDYGKALIEKAYGELTTPA